MWTAAIDIAEHCRRQGNFRQMASKIEVIKRSMGTLLIQGTLIPDRQTMECKKKLAKDLLGDEFKAWSPLGGFIVRWG